MSRVLGPGAPCPQSTWSSANVIRRHHSALREGPRLLLSSEQQSTPHSPCDRTRKHRRAQGLGVLWDVRMFRSRQEHFILYRTEPSQWGKRKPADFQRDGRLESRSGVIPAFHATSFSHRGAEVSTDPPHSRKEGTQGAGVCPGH